MKRYTFLLIGVLLALVALAGGAAAEPAAAPVTLSGRLTIIAGDPMDMGTPGAMPIERFFLTDANSTATELHIDPAARTFDLYRLNGQRVTVTGVATAALAIGEPTPVMAVQALAAAYPAAPDASTAVLGNTKWVTIACKFADVADEPRALDFFQNMYASTYPGLDHYWREASYDKINLAGSTAVGWYTLPQPLSYYRISHTNFKLNELFADCAGMADPFVDFSGYYGVNLMFNAETGCCAWGGNWYATLDGVSKSWQVTWLPPWAYQKLSVVQHEMTHAYGILWHAYTYDQPYIDAWDVVSDAGQSPCFSGTPHPTYGCVGQHTSAYHRAYLGWLPDDRIVEIGPGHTTLTLQRPTLPATGAPMLAILHIDGSDNHFYAIEVRQKIGYDVALPGWSLVIHEIGGPRHPVQLLGSMAGLGCGPLWQNGYVWASPHDDVVVSFAKETLNGGQFVIDNGLPIETIAFNATADTFIDQDRPMRNFGGSALLWASEDLMNTHFHAKASFLGFDAVQVPLRSVSVRLRLTSAESLPPTLPRIVPISQSHSCGGLPDPFAGEYAITWANWLDHVGYFYMPSSDAPSGMGANWAEYDITEMVNHWGSQAVNMLMVDYATGHSVPGIAYDIFRFSSREGSNPPQLIVDYLVPDEPTTTTFTPTNDAYVSQAKPKAIYGAKPTLQVKDAAQDLNSYVKFNVNSLNGTVQSATLRLWVNDPGPDGGAVYAVSPFYLNTTTQWLETGLRWNNAPAITGAPLDSVGNAVKGQWVELDVTSAVVAALGDNGRVSLAIANDSRNLVVYGSKEGPHPPELVIVTSQE